MNYYKNDDVEITEEIWQEYARSKNITLRNQILTAYLYIVTCNIKRMSGISMMHEEVEDMTNQGVLELINCIERYDCSRGIQFDTFASIRVRGCIIDYIRKKDWVPRDVRKRVKEVNEAENFLQGELKRTPTDSEIAKKLCITEEELYKIQRDEVSMNIIAFEDLLQENNSKLMSAKCGATYQHPEEKILNDEFKKVLEKSIDELDKNERMVISLYYYEELKLKEIAFVMDLTPSRISQIHYKALDKIKTKLVAYMK